MAAKKRKKKKKREEKRMNIRECVIKQTQVTMHRRETQRDCQQSCYYLSRSGPCQIMGTIYINNYIKRDFYRELNINRDAAFKNLDDIPTLGGTHTRAMNALQIGANQYKWHRSGIGPRKISLEIRINRRERERDRNNLAEHGQRWWKTGAGWVASSKTTQQRRKYNSNL